MPSRPQLQRILRSGSVPFVGALDAYASSLVSLYWPFRRLLARHTGYGIRARRSSDNALQWFGFNADGSFQAAEYLAWRDAAGAASGFAHTIVDQSGAGLDQIQTSAAAQAQIGVDGNGDYYLYAPGAGSATTNYEVTLSASVAAPEFMMWSVNGASGFWHVPMVLRDNAAVKERAMANYGTAAVAVLQDNASGSAPANITLTASAVYSTVFGANGSESKITNRLSTTTGTRVASACNIEKIGVGRISGGPAWLQNAPWYGAAAWNRYSSADVASLSALGKTLIPIAQ